MVAYLPPTTTTHHPNFTYFTAVIVEDQRAGEGGGEVVLGGQVEADLPPDLALPGFRHGDRQAVSLWHMRDRVATFEPFIQ